LVCNNFAADFGISAGEIVENMGK